MAKHEVPIVRIEIEEHPNADRLELAKVGEYRSIVQKGKFETGDLVAYIPEGSLVPEDVLRELNLWDEDKGKGMLAGSNGDRVKAVRLRNQLSQGLCYPVDRPAQTDDLPVRYFITRPGSHMGTKMVSEGDDVAEFLDIEKYVPPIPPALNGEVYHAGAGNTVKYDVENYKKYPEVIEGGEEVVYLEKIHGTNSQNGVLPQPVEGEGDIVVISKGLGSKNLAFRPEAEENKRNLYLRAERQYGITDKLKNFFPDLGRPVFVLGEIFGEGMQDLAYGSNVRQKGEIGFRAFDIYMGHYPAGHYLDFDDLKRTLEQINIPMVPVLYRGPFSKETMKEYTSGLETVSGSESHMREGIVIRPIKERIDSKIGRVQLKSVSEEYLTRKNATEYN